MVGNPANTNCLIAASNAPDLDANNFSAMTRLDQNRALTQLAQKLNVGVEDIDKFTIWGNHSSTMYPDITHATGTRRHHRHGPSGKWKSLTHVNGCGGGAFVRACSEG